jgi:outer membrane lipopolysaccharide assembly protein LptE/RlpB
VSAFKLNTTFYLLLLSLSLSSCGFQLKGVHQSIAWPFTALQISPALEHEPLVNALRLALAQNCVPVDIEDDSAFELKLSAIEFQRQPIALAPNGETIREQLHLSLNYVLLSPNHHLVQQGQLYTQRARQVKVGQQLADGQELTLFQQEMQHRLIQQLLYRLHYARLS